MELEIGVLRIEKNEFRSGKMKNAEMKNEHQILMAQAVKQAFGHDSWELVKALTQGHSPASIYKLRKADKLIRLSIQIKNEVQKTLTDKDDLKPCHCDIHPFNLLYDGNDYTLIDWTTAKQENFYFDLIVESARL